MTTKIIMSVGRAETGDIRNAPTFKITQYNRRVGTLKVATKGIYWKGKRQRQQIFLKWEDFDDIVRPNARSARRRG